MDLLHLIPMKVFRGTRDVSPVELDHKRVCPGVFGEATYFATNISDAIMYSGGGTGECAVVSHYEISEDNLLIVEEQEFDVRLVVKATEERRISSKLQEKLDYQSPTMAPINLAKVSLQSGYKGVLLKGFVEGGEQVVIPDEGNSPVLLQMDIILAKRILGTAKNSSPVEDFIQIMNLQGIETKEKEYQLSFSLTPAQLVQITDLFNFIFNKLKGRSFYSVDLNNLSIEEYE